MKDFFKFLFASILGFFISLLIIFFIFMAVIMAVMSIASPEVAVIGNEAVLHVRLDQDIPDRTSNTPFSFDYSGKLTGSPLGLNDIGKAIKRASGDERIKGILLDLNFVPAGMATLGEIRDMLVDFRQSGKFIIAYGETMSQKGYYLASVADEVFLHPEGLVDFRGISSEVVFIKGLLEKLNIEAQIIRHGEYKSAVEPLFLDRMSEASREQMTGVIRNLWDRITSDISSQRGISPIDLNMIADALTSYRAAGAHHSGLVDSLIYRDELLEILAEKAGMEKIEESSLVLLRKYYKTPDDTKNPVTRDQIAVIYAEGDITQGKSSEQSIGSADLAEEIRKARLSNTVKAIVLRVNSPGGDGLASDIILREVFLATQEKPVIASMGNVAASGGYYISCAATRIVAHPNTITGSIGVFGVIPNFGEMFDKKLGITFDGVKTNQNSDFPSVHKPLSPFQKTMMQHIVDDFYNTFVDHVANNRNMPFEEVDKIAEGRVWSGTEALALGLIDEFGGLDRAVEIAAEEAGISEYRTMEYPVAKDPFLQLMQDIMGESSDKLIRNILGEYYTSFDLIKKAEKFEGVQARLPYEIIIK